MIGSAMHPVLAWCVASSIYYTLFKLSYEKKSVLNS